MAISLKAVLIVLVFIAAVHAIATLKFLYWTTWWLDIPMHFVGGAWLAMLYVYAGSRLKTQDLKTWYDLILGLGFIALVGVLWEFSEFLLGNFMIIDQLGDYRDTLGDLFFDLLGGSIILAFVKQLRSRSTPLTALKKLKGSLPSLRRSIRD